MDTIVRYYYEAIYAANLRTDDEYYKVIEEARTTLLSDEYEALQYALLQDGIEI